MVEKIKPKNFSYLKGRKYIIDFVEKAYIIPELSPYFVKILKKRKEFAKVYRANGNDMSAIVAIFEANKVL